MPWVLSRKAGFGYSKKMYATKQAAKQARRKITWHAKNRKEKAPKMHLYFRKAERSRR